MTNNIYDTPKSELNQTEAENRKVSLSQSSGKKKLFVGLPASIICAVLAYLGIFSGITKMLSIVLGGYAIVGLIEIIGGAALASAAKKWESMPGWKKFIISISIILIALAGFIAIMPFIANYV